MLEIQHSLLQGGFESFSGVLTSIRRAFLELLFVFTRGEATAPWGVSWGSMKIKGWNDYPLWLYKRYESQKERITY